MSRQSVNDWIRGQVPRGTHFIDLSRILTISPNYFFSNEMTQYISIPLHRKRGVAKVTPLMRKEAFVLAEQYETDPGAMLPPDELLIEELQTATYEVIKGRVRVMKKETMRELLKRSPDRADALCLTFHHPTLLFPEFA